MDDNLPQKREREVENTRPRRARVPLIKKSHSLHDLVPLIAASNSMPPVTVHSDAMFTMSFHSHLCTDEIIGWLAGSVSDDIIEIRQAFPVKALIHENGRINVEMDAEDAVEVRSQIEENELSIVGWYHSHPTFEVHPSLMDIDNQLNYQGISEKYFLGGIISPYFSVNKIEGVFTVFCVKKNSEEMKRNGYHPAYSVRYNVTEEEISQECIRNAKEMVIGYKEHRKFVNVGKKWKKGITVSEKIEKALKGLRVKENDVREILELVNK